MSERYLGQLALVAGGTGGLGRAVSVAFLEEGATVVVTYRRQNEFEALRHAAGAHASRLEGHGNVPRFGLFPGWPVRSF